MKKEVKIMKKCMVALIILGMTGLFYGRLATATSMSYEFVLTTLNRQYQELIEKCSNTEYCTILKEEQKRVTKLFDAPGKTISFSKFQQVCNLLNNEFVVSRVFLNNMGIIKVVLKSDEKPLENEASKVKETPSPESVSQPVEKSEPRPRADTGYMLLVILGLLVFYGYSIFSIATGKMKINGIAAGILGLCLMAWFGYYAVGAWWGILVYAVVGVLLINLINAGVWTFVVLVSLAVLGYTGFDAWWGLLIGIALWALLIQNHAIPQFLIGELYGGYLMLYGEHVILWEKFIPFQSMQEHASLIGGAILCLSLLVMANAQQEQQKAT